MFAGAKGVEGSARVHGIVRRNYHRIDVFPIEQFVIIIEALAITANELLDLVHALGPDIANGCQCNVIIARVRFDLAHMGVKTLRADADKADDNFVVRAGHSRRGWLALPIDRRLY